MTHLENFLTLFLWDLHDFISRKKVAIILILLFLIIVTLGAVTNTSQGIEYILNSNMADEESIFLEVLSGTENMYSNIFFFMFLIIPVLVSISFAGDIESGITTAIISLPVTRRTYLLSKVISEFFIASIVFLFPPLIGYFYIGYRYSIWVPKVFALLSICLFISLIIAYLISLLWAVLQSHNIGSALSSIITLQMWLSLGAFLESIKLVKPDFTYNDLFIYSLTPHAIMDYLFDYLFKYPFSDISSRAWVYNFAWVVTNAVTVTTVVTVLAGAMTYYLFMHKDL